VVPAIVVLLQLLLLKAVIALTGPVGICNSARTDKDVELKSNKPLQDHDDGGGDDKKALRVSRNILW